MIIIPLITYLSNYNDFYVTKLIYISCSGGIGGTLYSIRGFYQHLGGDDFNINWKWWYIFRPIISCIVGIFIYFLIAGGLFTFNIVSQETLANGILFFLGLSFLAGLSFTKIMNKFNRTSNSLFSDKE